MRRSDYKNFEWYDVTDDAYWVEEYRDEFPNCCTMVYNPNYCCVPKMNGECMFGCGTMVKQGGWKFIIIEKPN